jgi:hypothetical protein
LNAHKVDDDRRRQDKSASVARHSAHRSVIGLWSRLSRFDRVVLVLFVLVLIIAAIGPFVAPYPPTFADPLQRLVSPSGAHPFGTDENGIDVLSRLIAAPRTDVLIAVIATTLSLAIGSRRLALSLVISREQIGERCDGYRRGHCVFSTSFRRSRSSFWLWCWWRFAELDQLTWFWQSLS